jgi:hypothetical protein
LKSQRKKLSDDLASDFQDEELPSELGTYKGQVPIDLGGHQVMRCQRVGGGRLYLV